MGFAIAQEFANRGAEVQLICGPVNVKVNHPNIRRVDVISANEMHQAVSEYFPHCSIAIMAAAVADYRPKEMSSIKMKKRAEDISLALEATIDILKDLGNQKQGQFLLGFALETNNELENAKKKLVNKNCDAIVLNSMTEQGAGFGHDTNKIYLLGKTHEPIAMDLKPKTEVAADICDYINKQISQ